MTTSAPPTSATDSVLVSSQPVPEGTQIVRGVDFDQFQGRDITVAEMVENMTHMGFQGSAVAEAARIINEMVCKTRPDAKSADGGQECLGRGLVLPRF